MASQQLDIPSTKGVKGISTHVLAILQRSGTSAEALAELAGINAPCCSRLPPQRDLRDSHRCTTCSCSATPAEDSPRSHRDRLIVSHSGEALHAALQQTSSGRPSVCTGLKLALHTGGMWSLLSARTITWGQCLPRATTALRATASCHRPSPTSRTRNR